ncbi:multifunctional CCA addition/repair protein [Utexia brackfieldae]|uniref:multifunctional CCA addition/repair protein n=1 Tax=Utexia brackfieldae TaxID=3074108 RepID=UPI00370D4A06
MNIYLVGGAVRDGLLKQPVTDKDWVIVGTTPEALIEQGYQQVGHDFPVFLHPQTKQEYALARTERKSGKGYTGFICDFNPHITLEQDLIRRDLTINAIAQDQKGQLIDPFHGIDDLEHKILRHISLTFREDPLRVLRVARFAARFHSLSFTIAPETRLLMKEMVDAGEIDYLTPERVWKETEKALKTDSPQIYFSVLNQCGALAVLFPEFVPLFAQTHHTKLDSHNHTSLALQQSALLTQQPEIHFAVLCQGIGETALSETEQAISRSDHHTAAANLIRQLCIRLKIPNSYRTIALIARQYYRAILIVEQLSAEQILQILNGIDVWRHPTHLTQLLLCAQADFMAMPSQQKAFSQATYLTNMYHVAEKIDVQKVIADGFKQADIKIELEKRRLMAIKSAIETTAII